jgi:7-carboxy-7-deazaguanine synthase
MKINEIYYSLQGEGILIGTPTVIVRTTGCNLRCKWCDTKYAYEDGKFMTVDEIMREIAHYKTKNVCLTGGEPLLQSNINLLIRRLLRKGYTVLLETNGSINVRNLPATAKLLISLDIKCPSSAMADRMLFSNIKWLDETDQLKFVIADKTDYEYAKNLIAKYKPICNIIFQPVDGVHAKKLAEWVLADNLNNVRVLIQLQKVIWGQRRHI